MGEMAEYYGAYEYESDTLLESELLDLKDQGYWRKKDGTEVLIVKMTDGHLMNTINLLTRTGDPIGYLNVMIPEASKRNLI